MFQDILQLLQKSSLDFITLELFIRFIYTYIVHCGVKFVSCTLHSSTCYERIRCIDL